MVIYGQFKFRSQYYLHITNILALDVLHFTDWILATCTCFNSLVCCCSPIHYSGCSPDDLKRKYRYFQTIESLEFFLGQWMRSKTDCTQSPLLSQKQRSVGRLGSGQVRIDEPISLAHPQNATITYLIREKGSETSKFVLVRLAAVFWRLGWNSLLSYRLAGPLWNIHSYGGSENLSYCW